VNPSTTSRGRSGGLPVFAFAIGGLLVGHALSYIVAVPDPHHRDLVLSRTGHGYLPTFAEIALVLTLAGAASLVGRVWHRGASGEPAYGAIAARLVALQVVAFAGQEITERLVAHVPLGELLRDHVLVIGVLTQVVVALVGASILRLLATTTERVATRARTLDRSRPALLAVVEPVTVAPTRRICLGSRPLRGPPSA
jgi:hypothetical protein